jgi:hypothetical protein
MILPMRSRSIAAMLVLLCGAVPASSQVLSLEFHDGHVRLTAENVPVSRILGEWARVGGTQIVNGERVPGPPVTLQLEDVPERLALDIVLRGAAGYMAKTRDTASPGASAFDKILVLPVSRASAVAPLPPPAPALPFVRRDNPLDIEDQSVPAVASEDEGRPHLTGPIDPIEPASDNPFGVAPGVGRPGTITPPPRPSAPPRDVPDVPDQR